MDRDEIRKKYDELLQTYREKNRKLLQTQELYDKLKRKAMLGQVQDAAEDAVESTLQIPSISNNRVGSESQDLPYFQSRDAFHGQYASGNHEQQRGIGAYTQPQANIPAHAGSWPRTFGAQSESPGRIVSIARMN
jgi:E3 ubiquitin-protein ligase CCNP1IP1